MPTSPVRQQAASESVSGQGRHGPTTTILAQQAGGLMDLGARGGARVLMVGAGGIGCELLKNLVMSATPSTFPSITIVDLDTIDLSNLNRQFLFQNKHIKQSKAQVARESALAFHPGGPEIIAHHASIYEERFDVAWFAGFQLVFNALDNLAARQHVNRMCLAAGVPLIESGTAGYLGQVSVHQKERFACYDCEPKPNTTKTYPVCTIRSTPSTPIHCVVWAKSFLFSRLFSMASEEAEEGMSSAGAEAPDAKQRKQLDQEANELAALFQHLGNGPAYAARVYDKIFRTDIDRLRTMSDLWKMRAPPLVLPALTGQEEELLRDLDVTSVAHDQVAWTVEQNVALFLHSTTALAARMTTGLAEHGDAFALEFDKDDADALDFVTAASNLRAHLFGIGTLSRFELKQMAGNIIPAIATTNAIVAGMMVILAFKVLSGKYDACHNSFLTYGGARARIFLNERPMKPLSTCSACHVGYFCLTSPALGSLSPSQDVQSTPPLTLRQVLECFAKASEGDFRGLAIGEELTIQHGDRLLYDVEFEDHLDVDVGTLGLRAGSVLHITYETAEDEETLHLACALTAGPELQLSGDFDRVAHLFRPKPKPQADESAADEEAPGQKRAAPSPPPASPSKRSRVLDLTDDSDLILVE